MPDETKPPRLPGAAPAALRQFVACTVDRVELDLGDMGWIPKPDLPGNLENVVTPSASVLDGWTSSSATIRVGYGDFISIDLPASIVDGELVIDTSRLTIGGVGTEVDKWVDAFNRMLRENGKQLDTLDVRGGKVTLTKKPRPVAADTGSSVAPVTSTAPTATTPPEEPTSKRGCFAWLGAAIAAIAVAVGLVVANSGDDGDDDAASPPTSGAPTTAASAPTTSTSTSTTTTSTTIAQVGQAPPPTGATSVALATCGSFDPATDTPPTAGAYLVAANGGRCDAAPDAYAPANCDDQYVDCSFGQAPGIILFGQPGTSHQFGATDALTADDGNSTELWDVVVRLFTDSPDQVVRVQSDCGGTLLTGEAPVDPGGVTRVEQPLLSFGQCRLTKIEAAAAEYLATNGVDLLDPDAVNRAAAAIRDDVYTVDASEPAPIPPDADRFNVLDPGIAVRNDWADSVNTINNTIGAGPVDDSCLWFFPPEDVEFLAKVLDACVQPDRFWVFAAGLTEVETELTVTDTLLGTTAAYANPLGQAAPAIVDTEAFATSDPLFDESIFPCGHGHLAFTACAPGEPPMEAGAFVTVSAVMAAPIPIEGDGTERRFTVGFSPSSRTYEIAQGDAGWTITSPAGDTRARALFRHDSVTLVVPQDELQPGGGPLIYVWTSTVDGRSVTQPAVPVVGVIRTRAIEITVPPADDGVDGGGDPVDAARETLADFYAALSASLAAGDAGFALDRLDPQVFDVYPTECPAALARFADPELNIEFVDAGPTAPWTWEVENRAIEIADATEVEIVLTGRGQTGAPSTAHVTLIDGEYHWFTLCTPP